MGLEKVQGFGGFLDGFFGEAAVVAQAPGDGVGFGFLGGEMVLVFYGGEGVPLALDLKPFGVMVASAEAGQKEGKLLDAFEEGGGIGFGGRWGLRIGDCGLRIRFSTG